MRSALQTALLLASFASVGLLGGAAVAAEPVMCAGVTEIPGGATLASDRFGNAILILPSGGVIRCDGSGFFADLAAEEFATQRVAGVETPPSSSSFIGARIAGWVLVQETFAPLTDPDAVGYLGSNADQTVFFWRTVAGGPVETWMFVGTPR